MAKADITKCVDILKDRSARYGGFVEQLPNYCQFIDAIKVVKKVNFYNPKVGMQVKGAHQLQYLLALKATRHLIEPENEDHLNDFVNYLSLSQELDKAELILDPRVFNPELALNYSTMPRTEMVMCVNQGGLFAEGVESKVKLKKLPKKEGDWDNETKVQVDEDFQGRMV